MLCAMAGINTAAAARVAAALLLLAAAAAAQDKLCDKCTCTGPLLNCTMQGLMRLPDAPEAWPTDIEVALFDNNGLVNLKPLPTLPKLRRLSFRHNRIQRIEDKAFSNLTALRELDLGSNQLSRLAMTADIFKGQYDKEEYQPMKNLSVLHLDMNSIHSLASDFFEHVTHLRVLSLAFNPLRVIDTPTLQAISSLAHLEALDLTHTGLSALPPHILHTLLNLTALNVSANEFAEVPDELQNAHQLKELRLSSNPISVLEGGSFPESLASLEELEMEYMHNLTRVGPGGLAPLKGLRRLVIAHSVQFSELHPDAFVDVAEGETEANATYPLIRELILRGDNLSRLDPDLLPRWDELRELDLQDNKWMCDCEMMWVVGVLEPIINRTDAKLLHNFLCSDPAPMRGYSIFSLHVRHYHLRCLDADGNHPENDGFILVGVLVGVLLAVPATLAAVLCWRRGGFPWPFSSGPASYSRAFYRRAENVDDF